MGRTDNKGHKTKGEPREIYLQGVKEPVAKVDELHNLFHKESPFKVEGGTHYRIESEMNSQSHYFEQKYRRKDTIWLAQEPVENVLGDSWYWNWNNFAVRALHMRVMNFILPFDYHKVWFGNVIKMGQEFPELMFEEELKQVTPIELREIQERNKQDEERIKVQQELEKKQILEKEGKEGLEKRGQVQEVQGIKK